MGNLVVYKTKFPSIRPSFPILGNLVTVNLSPTDEVSMMFILVFRAQLSYDYLDTQKMEKHQNKNRYLFVAAIKLELHAIY